MDLTHSAAYFGDHLTRLPNRRLTKQTWRIMKLLSFFMFIAFMSASATGNSQRVTMTENNVSLEIVFQELKKQTGYDFFYNMKSIKHARPVSIQVKNAILQDVLELCFKNQPLTYTITGKIVVIQKKENFLPQQSIENFAPSPIDISGRIVNEKGQPVIASIVIKGSSIGTSSNEQGYFKLTGVSENVTLIISGVSIVTLEYKVNGITDLGSITVKIHVDDNEEVVLNTGYQMLPRERATGSFVQLSNELINRRVSFNILQRLEDITPGLIFNRDIAGQSVDPITIRGRSTINANARPLIVVDNFPYDGEIENINPNDVENITILKDAAAASIWGAQAGNGVIVIQTKKGSINQRPAISFNSNMTFGEKPDLFYAPQMSISDFIDIERMLFDQGFYNVRENRITKPSLSPVVETLIAQRDGLISDEETERRIRQFKNQDLRTERDKHLNRTSINQQYAVNVRGGATNHGFNFSAGFDRNLPTAKGQESNRYTLSASNHLLFLNNKLKISSGVHISKYQTRSDRPGSGWTVYPYERFTDDNGNPRFVTYQYRDKAVEDIESVGLLNWQYSPLEEIGRIDDLIKITDYRVNTNINYEIINGLNAEVLYQYWQNENLGENFRSKESYFTRDMINTITQVNPDGSVFRPIPLGGIMDLSIGNSFSHQVRGQINFQKSWGSDHQITALGGGELKHLERKGHETRFYGYDRDLGLSQPVDNLTRFPQYFASGSRSISNGASHFGTLDRFVSYYANAAYTYKNKIVVTASTRKDASNLFGVETNQKGVPLWSSGVSWNISKEHFYNLTFLPYLKLRATYGYNGNVDKSLSAFTTAINRSAGLNYLSNLPFAVIRNPANPTLRWEKIGVMNLGIDFQFANQVITGSVEYFTKNSIDLIGDISYAPQTGITSFRGNFADMRSKGIDVEINSKNLRKSVEWETSFFFSYINEKVTGYDRIGLTSEYLSSAPVPLQDKPLHSIYSYHWAGLDPLSGDPKGLLNGDVSNDYAAIINAYTPTTLIHHGAARPQIFGAIRNNFKWNDISLSVNLSYRLNYFFRRNSIIYSYVFNNLGETNISHGDYSLRWQKPGDELITQVPSMPGIFSTTNGFRDNFYTSSAALVERGDHLRLQDVRLSYSLDNKKLPALPVRNAELYCYVNNLGILWSKMKHSFDPDYQTVKPMRSISIGLSVTF